MNKLVIEIYTGRDIHELMDAEKRSGGHVNLLSVERDVAVPAYVAEPYGDASFAVLEGAGFPQQVG